MMNNGRGGGGLEEDVIVSLGKVLSSVNIAGSGSSDAERRGSGGGQGGGYGAPGTAVVGSSPPESSWGAGAPAPAG